MRASLTDKVIKFLTNPYKLFVILTHHGLFRRMNDELYLKLLYRGVIGKKLHLNPPVTYNEKIQWLKLFDKNPVYPQISDKIAVRDIVRKRVGETYLVPILGVWDNPDEIDFEKLPDKFVLKCTHDSGGVIICTNKSTFDTKAALKDLKRWLKRDYSRPGREWPYQHVPRRVLAEEYIESEDGIRPNDYKFCCCCGELFAIRFCTNRRRGHADYLFFDPDRKPLRISDRTIELPEDYAMPKPPHYEEMLEVVKKLSAGFIFVRIDLYDTPKGVLFGEITLYDQSGLNYDFTEEGDRKMGEYIKLEELL